MPLVELSQASQNTSPFNSKIRQSVKPSPGKENAGRVRVKKHEGSSPVRVQKYKGSILDAVKTNDVEIVSQAIKDGVDLYKMTPHGSTAFVIASNIGNQDIVNLLMSHVPDMLNKANTHGVTPLMEAAKNGHKDVVDFLIQKGAELNLQDKYGLTPLMAAAKNGHSEIVDQLIEAGADLNLQDNHCRSAIAFASEFGSLPLVNRLMVAESGDDSDLNATYGMALISAAKMGHLLVVDFLIQSGAELNLSYGQGCTALGVAAERGHLSVITRLIEAEAAKCQISDYYNTSLMIAIRDRNSQMAFKLIEAGANVDANAGSTALIYAARGAAFSVARRLIEVGANPNLKDNNGRTALYHASDRGYKKNIVDLLIKAGANPNERGNNSLTPLMLAAQEGCCKDIVDLLVKARVDLEMKDINGSTALMHAGIKGHIKIVKLLLMGGADSSTLDLEQLKGIHCKEGDTKLLELVKLVELSSVADSILSPGLALTYDGIVDINFVLSRIHAKSPSRYEEIVELECSQLIHFEGDDSNIVTLPPIRLLINNIAKKNFASEISPKVRSLFEFYIEQSDGWDKYALGEYIDCLFNPKASDAKTPILDGNQLGDLFKIISRINIKILQQYIVSSPDASAALLGLMANIGLEPEKVGPTKRSPVEMELSSDNPSKKTRDEEDEDEVEESLLGGDTLSGDSSVVQLTGEPFVEMVGLPAEAGC